MDYDFLNLWNQTFIYENDYYQIQEKLKLFFASNSIFYAFFYQTQKISLHLYMVETRINCYSRFCDVTQMYTKNIS